MRRRPHVAHRTEVDTTQRIPSITVNGRAAGNRSKGRWARTELLGTTGFGSRRREGGRGRRHVAGWDLERMGWPWSLRRGLRPRVRFRRGPDGQRADEQGGAGTQAQPAEPLRPRQSSPRGIPGASEGRLGRGHRFGVVSVRHGTSEPDHQQVSGQPSRDWKPRRKRRINRLRTAMRLRLLLGRESRFYFFDRASRPTRSPSWLKRSRTRLALVLGAPWRNRRASASKSPPTSR